LILGGGFADEPDDDLYRFFSSHLGKEGRNYSGYRNETVDRLLEEGRSTLDPEARKRIYQEIQRELIVNPPYNFLVYLKPLYAVRKGVTGFTHKIFGHKTTPLWNVEEWSVEGQP
jgi:peptide/nickel transport system substrate-binding protein